MTILYGIGNCDTVRKARRWLDGHGVAYRFHDVRRDGLERQTLDAWITELGWENLLNRRGTTWRKLPQAVRDGIDAGSAATLMLEQPACIRRPLLQHQGRLLPGFREADYAALFARARSA